MDTANTSTGTKVLTLQEQRKRDLRIKNTIAYVILALFSVIFFLPFFYTVATSFKIKQNVFDGRFLPKPVVKPLFWNYFGKEALSEDNVKAIYTAVNADSPDVAVLEKALKMPLPNLESAKMLKTELQAQLKTANPDYTKARDYSKVLFEEAKGIDYDGAMFAGTSSGRIPLFARFYINSIVVGLAITILQLLTCSLAAYAFARLEWPGRDAVFLTYLGTMMVPGVVMMIPVFILFKWFNIVDSYPAIILPAAFSAYGTFMLRQYFMTIPKALEEAAVIDGASKFQILKTVILPLSKTALSTLAIFVFLYAWNDFMWPMIVINTAELKTLPIGLQSFQSGYGSQWHLLMSASVIVLLPLIIIFVFGQKYITKGIVMTGIK